VLGRRVRGRKNRGMSGMVGTGREHPLAFSTVNRAAYVSLRHRMSRRSVNYVPANCPLTLQMDSILLLGLPSKRGGTFFLLTLPLNMPIAKAEPASNGASALTGPVPSP
jgi:hypothetical protein